MDPNTSLICQVWDTKPCCICIPDAQLDTIIHFYHQNMNYLEMTQMYKMTSQHFINPKLKSCIEQIISTCPVCQWMKLPGRGYGHLLPHNAEIISWQEIAVDLIGPWTIEALSFKISFQALTIIDTVMTYPEIVWLHNKTSVHVTLQFEKIG